MASIREIYQEEILQLHSQGENKTSIANTLISKYSLTDKFETVRSAVRLAIKGELDSVLDKECDEYGIDKNTVKTVWYKSKHISIRSDSKTEQSSLLESLKDIVSSYNPGKLRTITKQNKSNEKAIKATIADMHVGLECNPNNESLFKYVYNEDVFNSNLDKVFNSLIKEYDANGQFDLLLIDDLGDGLDGWNAQTTRAGHSLDQNMTNEEAFRVYVTGKLTLIENCVKAGIAKNILVRNVCNDNHSGSFAVTANMAINMILDRTYDKSSVDFYVLKRFMEHFQYGDHTYVITHGKDKKFMFKGLPKELNDKAIKFINDYIDHYEINSKYIHLDKGDLHCSAYQRTKKFDYRNYMSFAPPSSWVQHNFGDCYSGYSIQVIPKYNNEVQHTDYYFEMLKSI